MKAGAWEDDVSFVVITDQWRRRETVPDGSNQGGRAWLTCYAVRRNDASA
jgi:hypothetical protein